MGLDLSQTKFVLTQPNSAEEALDQAENFAKSGAFDALQTVTKRDGNGGVENKHIGQFKTLLLVYMILIEIGSSPVAGNHRGHGCD